MSHEWGVRISLAVHLQWQQSLIRIPDKCLIRRLSLPVGNSDWGPFEKGGGAWTGERANVSSLPEPHGRPVGCPGIVPPFSYLLRFQKFQSRAWTSLDIMNGWSLEVLINPLSVVFVELDTLESEVRKP